MCRLHLQGRRNIVSEEKCWMLTNTLTTLKMKATHSSKTLVYNKPTRRHIPQDGILHSHLSENIKSYKSLTEFDFMGETKTKNLQMC
jgi:hypothetical protein